MVGVSWDISLPSGSTIQIQPYESSLFYPLLMIHRLGFVGGQLTLDIMSFTRLSETQVSGNLLVDRRVDDMMSPPKVGDSKSKKPIVMRRLTVTISFTGEIVCLTASMTLVSWLDVHSILGKTSYLIWKFSTQDCLDVQDLLSELALEASSPAG